MCQKDEGELCCNHDYTHDDARGVSAEESRAQNEDEETSDTRRFHAALTERGNGNDGPQSAEEERCGLAGPVFTDEVKAERAREYADAADRQPANNVGRNGKHHHKTEDRHDDHNASCEDRDGLRSVWERIYIRVIHENPVSGINNFAGEIWISPTLSKYA